MNDPDIQRDPDEANRTYWRVMGCGGALIFSLLAWAAVFWLIGQGVERHPACVQDPEAAEVSEACAAPAEG
jgi:hypothetical protein